MGNPWTMFIAKRFQAGMRQWKENGR